MKEDGAAHWDQPESRFAGLLVCDNPACGDPTACSGLAIAFRFQVGGGQYEQDDAYRVHAIAPPPAAFVIHEAVPAAVRERLRGAFGLLWSDHDAAANKIRQAIECLLDERGVQKFPRTGKRTALPLHGRIERFERTNPEAGSALKAVKWIGNAGSHSGGLTREDLLDALEIMEIVLEETYVRHVKSIMAKITRINARKRPLGRRSHT